MLFSKYDTLFSTVTDPGEDRPGVSVVLQRGVSIISTFTQDLRTQRIYFSIRFELITTTDLKF